MYKRHSLLIEETQMANNPSTRVSTKEENSALRAENHRLQMEVRETKQEVETLKLHLRNSTDKVTKLEGQLDGWSAAVETMVDKIMERV